MFTITLHDLRDDTPEAIAERVEYGNRLRAELLPDEPPETVEQATAVARNLPLRHRRLSFRARVEGELVANATFTLDPDDDNPDVLWVGINVLPAHRRRGIGSRLLAHVVEAAQNEGKRRLVGATSEGVDAGVHFAEAAGATSKQAQHLNHLPLAEVDRSMLERWVADAATRSADYELIGWNGPVPEEHVGEWLELVLVMNTAPLDDLELNDFTLTEEQLRDAERAAAALEQEEWVLVARHRASGTWVGFHNVGWIPSKPNFVYVGATGVQPDHRGHALGKWLKAVMTLRILDERPDVTHVRTGNADSNDAMLGINRAMGYRPLIGQTTWELPVERAAAWLADRAAPAATG